jgi:hypothetical protein
MLIKLQNIELMACDGIGRMYNTVEQKIIALVH